MVGQSLSHRPPTSGEMLEYLERRVGLLRQLLDSFDLLRRRDVMRATRIIASRLAAGGKLLIAGNGGSAAQAQHLAAELVGRFQRERAGMPAIALTTDTSVLTAVSNDYGYSDVFARQVLALGRPGDVLLMLSTSGNSPNLVKAAGAARRVGMASVALIGGTQSALADEVDLAICLPSPDPATVQEGQLLLVHIVCGLTEMALEERTSDGTEAELRSRRVGGQS